MAKNEDRSLAREKLRKEFAKRLTREMLEQGYRAPRSDLKVDAKALQEAAGVKSRETARKYIKAEMYPELEVRKRLAKWLGVRQQWLEYGDLPKKEGGPVGINPLLLSQCSKTVQAQAKNLNVKLSNDDFGRIVALVYADAERSASGSLNLQIVVDNLHVLP